MTGSAKRIHLSRFMRSWLAGILGLVAPLAFAQSDGSPTAERDRAQHHYDQLAKAPEKARARSNPLVGDPDAPAAGRKLFEQHCAECHGSSAAGGTKAPSLRAEEVQQATDGTLFWILTNGVVRRGMPVWSKLPEPQRWQLVLYIRTLRKTGPAAADPAQ